MNLPKDVRQEVRARLWAQAEEVDWGALGSTEKARFYTQWTDSENIGGVLSRYMDPRVVRVYIKDTLLKGFGREKLTEHRSLVLRIIDRNEDQATHTFIKPLGFRFSDGLLVAWGRADDWKALLGSLFERSYGGEAESVGVLFKAAPRFMSVSARAMVESAAKRLGTSRCVWFD